MQANGCHFNCARFYYTSRYDDFTLACSTKDGAKIEEGRLLFDDISYNPDADSIEVGGVYQQTRLLSNGTALLVSIDEVNPNHFISYTLTGKCRGVSTNSTFTLLERVHGGRTFSNVDYFIFGLFLVISCVIGLGFALHAYIKQRRANQGPSTTDFLLASRSMHVAPLTLSLISSFMSAISLLGTPAEVYVFGTQYLVIVLSYVIFMPFAAHVMIPFYYNLRITSVYEYLELRFSMSIRRVAALVYVIHMTIYMAMAVYLPSIALQAVTGLSMWISVFASSAICILYTSLGGLRSAVWTDVFQVLVMVAGVLAALIQGSIREGGLFDRAWQIAERGGRIEFFNFDPSPFLRHTFWTVVIGGTVNHAFQYCINQAQIQRALSAKTLKDAQLAYWLNVPGQIIFMLIPGVCGILLYARYQYCDPMKENRITKRDQLLALYVMEVLSEDLPGFAGLFLAMLFSASLSTVSSVLNGLGAVVIRDFAQPLVFERFKVSDANAARISGLITFLFGVMMIVLILFIRMLPGILDFATAMTSAFGGPVFGVFLTGIYLPFVKWQAALIAMVLGLGLNMVLTFGNWLARPRNFSLLRTSTEACLSINETARQVYDTIPINTEMEDWERFFSISYICFGVVGIVLTITISLLLTPVFGCEDPKRFKKGWVSPVSVRIMESVQDFCCRPRKSDNEIKSTDPVEQETASPLIKDKSSSNNDQKTTPC